jgi:hypothetical protein
MGRWFGFRSGYQDLVRLFIGRNESFGKNKSIDLYQAFEGVCRDEEDFREQLVKYSSAPGKERITPQQVPPLVPAHLLLPTSRNKMFNARINFENYSEDWSEPTMAPYIRKDIAHNENLTIQLIKKLKLEVGTFEYTDDENNKIKFDANVGILSKDLVKSYLDFNGGYKWIDNKPIMQRVYEFIFGSHGDNCIDSFLFFSPQLENQSFDWINISGIDFSGFHRSRMTADGRYKAYSEKRHRNPCEYFIGKIDLKKKNKTFDKYKNSRQAIFLFYPVKDMNKEGNMKNASMAFALLFPKNKISVQIKFVVIDDKNKDAIVINR